jgi:hypothetical protein
MRSARAIAGAVLALALAGCSSEGPTDLGRVGLLAVEELRGTEAPPATAPDPTPEELARIRSALIAVSFPDGRRALVVPVAKNGPYLTYADAANRAVILRGGLLAGTRGQPFDLAGVRHGPDDPIANPKPLPDWPATLDREYQFTPRGRGRRSIVLTCQYPSGTRETVEIAGRRHAAMRVEERCVNARRRVSNTYWVAPETGEILKSEQWAGPELPMIGIEVIRPFRG